MATVFQHSSKYLLLRIQQKKDIFERKEKGLELVEADPLYF